jgi:hypothetical protein
VVIFSEPEPVAKLKVRVTLNGDAELSLTWIVTVELPCADGIPLINPELASIKPAGRVPPLKLHVKGAIPPSAASKTEYGIDMTPSGKVAGVVIVRAGFATSRKG